MALFIAMHDLVKTLFNAHYFMPHGHCYFWMPEIVWLHVLSDGTIAAAYFSIPMALRYFVLKRPDLPYRWMFLMFSAFIGACGTTHVMEIVTLWKPLYWLSGGVKAFTAFVSAATAVALIPLIPKALSLRSPKELERINEKLQKEITERQQAEENLRRSQEQVVHLQKMEAVGRLAGGVAHDFNNIMTGILGCSETLQDSLAADDPRREEVVEIVKASQRASALTRQLLAFSRRQIVSPKKVNLNAVTLELERLLQRLLPESVQLTLRLSPEPLLVYMDPGQFEQIIMNLVVNARDAMPKGGRILIKTSAIDFDPDVIQVEQGHHRDAYAVITVSDSGVGISREIQSRIFEPFFTTKDLGKGTGLGLSTVYGIVKQNGGDVRVQSREGLGTTFSVFLPIQPPADDSKPAQPVFAPEVLRAPAGGATILLVEDEELVLRNTSRMLQNRGYTVYAALSPKEALRLFSEHGSDVDLVVTDVVMPEMNGRQLTEELHRQRPDVRVLFISGYPEEIIAQHGVLQEGISFLEKPFTSSQLVQTINSLLENL